MPIYEYHCASCGQNFDAIQKFSDAPLSACRECGAEGVRKLLSAPSFRLKGGGWYETDFKNKNQRNVVKKDGDGASTSGNDSSASKSDSGSASKSESSSKNEGAGKSDSGSKEGGSSKSSSDNSKSPKNSGGSGSASAA